MNKSTQVLIKYIFSSRLDFLLSNRKNANFM